MRKQRRLKENKTKVTNKIICPKCRKSFSHHSKFKYHPCQDNRFKISEYLKIAKSKYKEKGYITPQGACIFLSCQPSQDLCRKIGAELQVSDEIVDIALALIKTFEKEKSMKQPSPPTPPKLASAALYIAFKT